MHLKKYGLSLGVLASSLLFASYAQAQQADPAQSNAPTGSSSSASSQSDDGTEEVIVTAQRREENLQNVPIAVTAITANALQQGGVVGTADLSVAVPGLLMTRQQNGSTPYIRGVGLSSSTSANENSVATYVDGVYYMASIGDIFSFNNIERVEVLRGPQGTLFGRNTTGGIISIVTRDPAPGASFDGTFSYGNYGTAESALYANVGNNLVAANFSAHILRQDDGYGVNLTTGADVNRTEDTAFRAKVMVTPTTNDTFTFSADVGRWRSDVGMVGNVLPGHTLVGGTTFQGTIYDTQADKDSYNKDDSWGASAHYVHDFGTVQLSLLSAVRQLDADYGFDVDATPQSRIAVDAQDVTRTFQNELLLTGDADQLQYTAGVFLFNALQQDAQQLRSATSGPTNFNSASRQETQSYAVFGQGTYSLSNDTRLTAGIRYTIDERQFAGHNIAAPGNPQPAGSVLASVFESKTFEEPTWRLSIDHDLTDRALVYASYNRGFKSGLYNTSGITNPVINPEELDAYELGLKSEWFDRQVRLNIAAFYYDYKDIQLSRQNGAVAVLLNAAAAHASGFEIESTYTPHLSLGHLTLSADVSYLDTEYTSFPGGPLGTPIVGGGNTFTAADLSGNEMLRSPKWSGTLSADYDVPVGPGFLGFNVTYYRNSGFYWEADNRLRQPAFGVLNAQLSYDFGENKAYRIALFGRNLTDEQYYVYVTSSTVGDRGAAAAPETYGVSLGVHF